jgi:glutamate carboxypeptidase
MKTPEEKQWVEVKLQEWLPAFEDRDGFIIELHGGFTRAPKPMTAEQETLFTFAKEVGAELGIEIAYKDTGGCCDGNNLLAADLPNIDTLGVRGGNIHSDKEFMVIESLAERAKLSCAMLMAFASGKLEM